VCAKPLIRVQHRKNKRIKVPVAHTCNPSYSGGRDQKDRGSKPAWANSSVRPYLEKPFTKIGLGEWLKVKAVSSSPSTEKKKKKAHLKNKNNPAPRVLKTIKKQTASH
jgi:hypothetical protein